MLSELAKEMLTPLKKDMSTDKSLWLNKTCEACNMIAVDEPTWIAHLNSRTHKNVLRRNAERAEREKNGYPVGKSAFQKRLDA